MLLIFFGAVFLSLGCSKDELDSESSTNGNFLYEVVATYPHDETAFTQGLEFHQGSLFETTGQRGQSRVREVDLETGKSIREHALRYDLFGEGMTIFGDELVQLTYQSGIGIFYDLATFQEKRRFNYEGEGWGLTNDGTHLIMSNGTSILTFLDPKIGKPLRQIEVKRFGKPVANLNELEYVDGVILANIWQQDIIARINPKSGEVLGYIDLRDIRTKQSPLGSRAEVLNGIAYDREQKRLFVTGKLWTKLFEIKLIPKS